MWGVAGGICWPLLDLSRIGRRQYSNEVVDVQAIVHSHSPTVIPFSRTSAASVALTFPLTVMAAVANAIYNALGKRFYALPMSPPKVWKALSTK